MWLCYSLKLESQSLKADEPGISAKLVPPLGQTALQLIGTQAEPPSASGEKPLDHNLNGYSLKGQKRGKSEARHISGQKHEYLLLSHML